MNVIQSCQSTLPTVKLKRHSASTPKPLKTGQEEVPSITEQSKIELGKPGSMILNPLETTSEGKNLMKAKAKSTSFMQGFLPENRKEIFNDKSSSSKPNSLKPNLSKTLAPDSTGKGRVFADWWKKSAGRKSRELWLPIGTAFAGSEWNFLNKSVKNTIVKLLQLEPRTKKMMKARKQKGNLNKTSFPSSTSLLQEATEDVPTLSKPSGKNKKPKPNAMKKIRIYPTEQQRIKLNQVFGANRWMYNRLVEKAGDALFEGTKKEKQKELRPYAKKRGLEAEGNVPEFVKESPEECLDSAYRDLFKARKTTLSNSISRKSKTGKGFKCKLSFKSWRAPSQTIEVRRRSFKFNINPKKHSPSGLRLWPRKLGLKKDEWIKFKGKFPAPDQAIFSFRLQRKRNGKFYLCIPLLKKFSQTQTNDVCGIDPGVTPIFTGYSPNHIFEVGKDKELLGWIKRRRVTVNKLKSTLRKFKGKRRTRHKLRKLLLQINSKITRRVEDHHHKVTKTLSENYNTIYLPTFETQNMVRKRNRTINSLSKETKNDMISLSHYKFKQLLRYKMDRTGGRLIDCTEELTTKTCGHCGKLNYGIGRSKIFKCPFCKYVFHRDVNAARNIYLKCIDGSIMTYNTSSTSNS